MLDLFLKILNGEKPNGVVWTADLSYWIIRNNADRNRKNKPCATIKKIEGKGCQRFST